MTIFATVSVVLARMPAFAQLLPSVSETLVGAVLTVLAGFAAGGLALRATALVEPVALGSETGG